MKCTPFVFVRLSQTILNNKNFLKNLKKPKPNHVYAVLIINVLKLVIPKCIWFFRQKIFFL